jgi:hypothetical protein
LEEETETLIRATALGTVTPERRGSELRRLAEEGTGVEGLALLAGWGLVQPRSGGLELARAVDELLGSSPWADEVDQADAILAAVLGPEAGEGALASAHPSRPSEGVALARGHDAIELVLARAAGATWLDDWLVWREVRLEITGTDLTAAGVQGPAVGIALEAALAAKLDGTAKTRPDELRVALAVTDTNR